MTEEQRGHHHTTGANEQESGPVDENVEFWMSTPGDEDTSVWDNMVQAFKPNLIRRARKKLD